MLLNSRLKPVTPTQLDCMNAALGKGFGAVVEHRTGWRFQGKTPLNYNLAQLRGFRGEFRVGGRSGLERLKDFRFGVRYFSSALWEHCYLMP